MSDISKVLGYCDEQHMIMADRDCADCFTRHPELRKAITTSDGYCGRENCVDLHIERSKWKEDVEKARAMMGRSDGLRLGYLFEVLFETAAVNREEVTSRKMFELLGEKIR